MNALVYEKAHGLDDFAIHLSEVSEPALREFDILVDVKAIGVNPGETWFRKTRSAEPGGRLLLGWEFAGVVGKTGSAVQGYEAGDRVFGTGDVSRDGCWAERVAVDSRIVAKIPEQLSFADAASLPIGGLTAWETIFREHDALPGGVDHVIIVGGAGGVGSIATQLLKAKTKAFVISTASRPESRKWCLKMGADLVIDHSEDLADQLKQHNISNVDMVVSTAGTSSNIGQYAGVLRAFGHLGVVDAAPVIDASALMLKSTSVHLEMVFSKILHGHDLSSQASILKEVAALAAESRVQPIATTILNGLVSETMRAAHELLETGRTIGKVVIVA